MGMSVNITNTSSEIKDFSLNQNYPNPFNPETKISYSIPNKSDVKIAIYNNMGKEVAKYIYENQAAGSYEINWNAKDLPSGVYYYKLISENFSDTKKMILLK